MRVTKRDLEKKVERVNYLLRNVKLKVAYRFGYTAIDVMKNNVPFETLISGITKRQAYDILDCIERLKLLEDVYL